MWTKVSPESMLVGLGQKGCRTISSTVISGILDMAPMSQAESDLWSEQVGSVGMTQAGEIANFGDETELVTPAIQQAMDNWLKSQNINASRRHAALPLACTGAGFHHDADSYRDEIFCVLWLSDDTPWDVYFPYLDKRIALTYGTIFVFDSAQPHGVVPHGETVFNEETFEYHTGVFVSQDLVIDRECQKLMGIHKLSRHGRRNMHILNADGMREDLSPETGGWSIRYIRDRT